MKTKLLTTLLIAIGMMAYGQSGTYLKADTAKTSLLNRYTTGGHYGFITQPKSMERFYHFNVDTRPIMRISDLKPDSSYHVWIDKKAIKWTSDSTFIMKRKSHNPQ